MTPPPVVSVCPECGALCAWMPAHYILYQLQMGQEFVIMFCPQCDWTVKVEAEGPPILTDVDLF